MSNYRRYFDNERIIVFITFVTYKRKNILINNIDTLRNSFKITKSKFDFNIVAITVMNNHCHLLLETLNPDKIPQIIRDIKYNFSINIDNKYINDLSLSAQKRGEKGIWQRRYYDHIIRDENDLYRHIDYIHYNSVKHYDIKPNEWQYSSFRKFVKNKYYDVNWCNFGDKNKVVELNLE